MVQCGLSRGVVARVRRGAPVVLFAVEQHHVELAKLHTRDVHLVHPLPILSPEQAALAGLADRSAARWRESDGRVAVRAVRALLLLLPDTQAVRRGRVSHHRRLIRVCHHRHWRRLKSCWKKSQARHQGMLGGGQLKSII